jgi:DNA-binding transcriptional LysR family regulator
MNTDARMFLLAAEELNFTKAAGKAFVTQQCLSAHIKNLEKRFGTKLFIRTPHLALTPAGKILYRSLRKIQIIETSAEKDISGVREGVQGHVTIGMNAGRVQLLLPALYDRYHQEFPKVTISVEIDDVRNQAKKLLDGKIDFLVGVNCPPHRDLVFTPVVEESIFFLATDSFLQRYAQKQGAYPRTLRTGVIDMAEYRALPIVENAEASTLVTAVARYCQAHHLIQDTRVRVSDSDAQVRLSATGLMGMYLAESLLGMPQEYNRLYPDREPLRILSPQGMHETLRFDIVNNRNASVPLYIRRIQELLRDTTIKEFSRRRSLFHSPAGQ